MSWMLQVLMLSSNCSEKDVARSVTNGLRFKPSIIAKSANQIRHNCSSSTAFPISVSFSPNRFTTYLKWIFSLFFASKLITIKDGICCVKPHLIMEIKINDFHCIFLSFCLHKMNMQKGARVWISSRSFVFASCMYPHLNTLHCVWARTRCALYICTC